MRYASAALPVPRVTETGTVFDQFYAISERADGEFIDRLNAEQLRRALTMRSRCGGCSATRPTCAARPRGARTTRCSSTATTRGNR